MPVRHLGFAKYLTGVVVGLLDYRSGLCVGRHRPHEGLLQTRRTLLHLTRPLIIPPPHNAAIGLLDYRSGLCVGRHRPHEGLLQTRRTLLHNTPTHHPAASQRRHCMHSFPSDGRLPSLCSQRRCATGLSEAAARSPCTASEPAVRPSTAPNLDSSAPSSRHTAPGPRVPASASLRRCKTGSGHPAASRPWSTH